MSEGAGGETARATAVDAPGKVILVGEHAVNHGQLAIAMPFAAVSAQASVTFAPGPVTITAPGADERAIDHVTALVADVAAACQAPLRDMAIAITATIPPGRGLGSSAAVAVAVVRAVSQFLDRGLDEATLAALIAASEDRAHGRASGLDAAAVLAAGPIAFRRGEPPRPLPVAGHWFWIVADTGVARQTADAVAAVAAGLASDSLATRARLGWLGELAKTVEQGLATGNPGAVGAALDEAQIVLDALGVGDAQLTRLITAAREAGALGAKLTGAGRGGAVLALAADAAGAQAVHQAFLAAGAPLAWVLAT